ncbi:MAG: hypothetical protein ABI224_17910 [Acetobacteraceae bacterium]
MRQVCSILPIIALAACASNATPTPIPDITQAPKLDGAPIQNVLTRVKQEVGLFYSDGAKAEQNWPQLLSDLKVTPVCGNGHIAFEITSIKMEFSAVNDATVGGSGGLKIPFAPAPAGASVSPALNGSQESVGNIDLVYTYKPLASGPVSTDYDIIRNTAIILPTLDNLRDGLIKATAHRPCFKSLTSTDPVQTLTFSVDVVKDTKESLGFNFYFVSLSGSNENKNTGKNTITVSYRPIPFPGGEQNLMLLHKKINS